MPSAPQLLIAQRVAAVTRALPAAREGDAHAIHQARVATRRLREALPLLQDGKSRRRASRQARRVTRALGPVRELDVALEILDQLDKSGDVTHEAVACLQSVMAEERRRLFDRMVRRLDRGRPGALRKKAMSAARRSGGAAETTGGPRRLAAARDRAAARAGDLRAAIDGAAGLYLPDRLHEVRIAIKKLRYTIEIVKDLSGSRATASITTLKRAQDLLGRMHDLEVLIARTRGVQASSGAPGLRLSGDLDRLVRRLETECRQLHGHYMAARRGLLRVCDACERQAGSGRRESAA